MILKSSRQLNRSLRAIIGFMITIVVSIPADADKPNILLIVSEDNGPEIGCYGDKFARTPNLNSLAKQGTLFKTAYVTQSVCSPSRSTLFTGLYPHQNGQIGLATHQFRMFREFPSSYSLLKKKGYRTGLIGKTHVNPPEFIERHVDFRAIRSANFGKKNLADYAKKTAEFINASDKPFFLTVNFPDAHWPLQNDVDGRPKTKITIRKSDAAPLAYVAFTNERMQKHFQAYYNCLSRLDECVGELIAEIKKSGKLDNTLIIYVGDHGAQFARGKVTLYEGGLRIPFVVRWPGKVLAEQKSDALVSTIDILPTMLAAAEIKPPKNLPGKNLLPILSGKTASQRQYLFGERTSDSAGLHFPQRAVRDKRYKLIHSLLLRPDPAAKKHLKHGASNFRGSPSFEELKTVSAQTDQIYKTFFNPPDYQLYDLKNDPQEFTNLAFNPEYKEIKKRLIARLEKWQVETKDMIRQPELLKRLTAENDECLKKKIRSPQNGWKYVQYLNPEKISGQQNNSPGENANHPMRQSVQNIGKVRFTDRLTYFAIEGDIIKWID